MIYQMHVLSRLGSGVFALSVFLISSLCVCSAAKQPNIIMIMADDMGVECIGAYGAESYETPHLDKLAAGGIRFNHAHSQPICTPSRVQIMTGIYNNRNYVKFGVLDPEVTTFAHVLKDAGYKTAIAGKWQLEGGFKGPNDFGFDNYCLWQLTRRPNRYPNPGLEVDGVEKDFKNGGYGPDLVTDYLCDYIEANKEGPFFVYYPMIMPHYPFPPTPDDADWDPMLWRDTKGEGKGHMGPDYWPSMVRYTDKMVGKIVSKLDELGIRENTLLMWTGDNGTHTSLKSTFNGMEYPGGKGSTKDNGTHVGFIANWPGKIDSGQVLDDLVDLSDVFPTLVDVAGADVPEELDLDGVSLEPLFRGKKRKKPFIYCWYERNGKRGSAKQLLRDQVHKLYADGSFYDTTEDLLEKNNLAANGVPEPLRGKYERMKKLLGKHVAISEASDEVQQAKAEILSRDSKDKAKAEKKKKKKQG